MTNKGLSKLGLRLLDRATDSFPSFGPNIFQRAFVGIMGSRIASEYVLRRYRHAWSAMVDAVERCSITAKILVVADVCIGDAVLLAAILPILRERFPDTELHYACNRTGGELVEGIPGVRVHNIIEGDLGFPTQGDLQRLRALAEREQFRVALNFGPFLKKNSLGRASRTIPLYVPLAAWTLRAWNENGARHLSYLLRQFAGHALGVPPDASLNTNAVYLSADARARAKAFLDARGISRAKGGIAFFNPDATSRFGQIPIESQKTIVRKIAEMNDVSALLIGRAYSSEGVEQTLIASIPEPLRKKVHVVPHIPIEAYTALIDASDMFLSGDTGPLHISACRKLTKEGHPLRNKTAIVAIYGATDSRMYGYDSEQPFHAPANQDAPSRSFSAPAACRNISCINKFGKSCADVRCFGGLPVDDIIEYVARYFQMLEGRWIPLRVQEPIATIKTREREFAF